MSPSRTKHFICLFNISPILLFAGLLFAGLAFPQNAIAGKSPQSDNIKRHVLILNSYHPGLIWTDKITESIKSTLSKNTSIHTQVHVEYLDTKRFQKSEYLENYLQTIFPYKLSQIPFDLVIVSDNDAFNFVVEHRQSIFPDIPVIFCGVNGFTPALLKGEKNITGIAETPEIEQTLKLALSLHPNTKHVIAIGENDSITGKTIFKQFKIVANKLKGPSYQYWLNKPLEEIESDLNNIPADTIFFLNSVIKDSDNHIYSFADTAKIIHANTPLPIYGLWEFFLGNGIVGGKLINPVDHGTEAAQIALQIFKGTDISEIPVRSDVGSRYMFDYHELERLRIQKTKLPTPNIIINQPNSFYSISKAYLWIGVAFFLILLIASSLLSITNIHKKKAETALLQSQKQLNAFCNALPDLSFIINEDGLVIDVLASDNALLYSDTASVIGRSYHDIFPESIADNFIKKINSALSTNQMVVFEYPLEVPAGNLTFEARVNPMGYTLDNKELVVWAARDITEQIASKERDRKWTRLANLEVTISTLLNAASESFDDTLQECIQHLTAHSGAFFGRIWVYNDKDDSLKLHASAGEYTHTHGIHSTIPIHSNQRVSHIASLRKPYLTNDFIHDHQITNPEWAKGEGIIAFSGYPLIVDDVLIGMLALFFQKTVKQSDFEELISITNRLANGIKRHLTEQKLHQAIVESESSRDQITAIIRSMADGLIVIDPMLKITLINNAAESMLGSLRIPRRGESFTSVINDAIFLDRLSEVRSGIDIDPFVIEMSDHTSKEIKSIEIQISQIITRDECFGLALIFRDVTQDQIINRMKNEFISIAAHELRTPLTTIIGYSELLTETTELNRTQQEYVNYIIEKGDVLETIIGDMLNIERIESGRSIILDKSPCDIVTIIDATLGHLTKENPDYIFERNCSDSTPLVVIDKTKIIRVLDNLFTNAIKYSSKDFRICLTCKQFGNMLQISIKDHGIGMTPDQLEKIFDKFYRVDTTNTAISGLGLGMSICKSIIESHGGSIWIESEYGKGTEVFFALPLESEIS